MGYLLFAVASLFGSLLAWRALRETCLLLVLALGPLLGSSALVALSNARFTPNASLGLLLLASALLALRAGQQRPTWIAMTRWQGRILALLALMVVGYTHYHQVNILDSDRWLHDAQTVAFRRGIYPPVNPFFPELAMNGHFGRDLFMATLSPQGSDPVGTIWWVSPILQLATFLTLFASGRTFTTSYSRGLLLAVMVFFGICCGFRVGLIDTFDGTNGLAYPHCVLLVHLMTRILHGCRWPAWMVSGVVLGTYQLVYMTNFALLLITGLLLFLVQARSRQAWAGLLVTGILAMGLAVTEGGAFTDMANRGLKPELHKAVQNQGLRVTVAFPKEHLFQVLTSTGGYYRTSVAYQTSLFEGLYRAPRREGYISIFSPEFMRAHWLALYLAPLTLWLLRRSSLGLAFWIFGAVSYLLPGLFYFGPIFEYEYFRFEFSAAFGFAGALGLALGQELEKSPLQFRRSPLPGLSFGPGSVRYLIAVAVLVASVAAGEKLLNDALIASQKRDFQAFPSVREWRLREQTFGLTPDTLAACDWLNGRTKPGQQLLSNFLNDRPMGLWPDMVAATLAGVFPAGHGYPSETEGGPHGNPAFHQNSVYRAFWSTGDLTLLEGSKVAWLLADRQRLEPKVKSVLEALPHQTFGELLVVPVPPRPLFSEPRSNWKVTALGPAPANEDLRIGASYPLPVVLDNQGSESRLELKLEDGLLDPLRAAVPKGSTSAELSLVTPLDEGTYRGVIADLAGQEKGSFEITIDFLARLQNLEAALSFPQLKANRLYTLEGVWKSSRPLHSVGELDVMYRFRRPDGDYAWEVDLIPQPIDFQLPERAPLRLQIHTPNLAGPYELEIWFFDRATGRRLKMKTAFPVTVES